MKSITRAFGLDAYVGFKLHSLESNALTGQKEKIESNASEAAINSNPQGKLNFLFCRQAKKTVSESKEQSVMSNPKNTKFNTRRWRTRRSVFDFEPQKKKKRKKI